MKNLIKLNTLLLILCISSVMIISSCKKDEKIVEGVKTTLNATIVEADALAVLAVSADYPQASIDAYKTILASVKTAAVTPLTQTEIDNLDTQLKEAMKTFKASAYGFIDETLYLNAGWHFDEGTGTTATAFSTTKHVATFKTGMTKWMVNGTTLPTWVNGVKGGKAVYLTGGAHLEVPASPLFLPVSLTISVWVKADDVFADDYIVSQNYWQGYKFQTQSTGRAFFTMKKVDGGIVDKDNEVSNSAVVGTWTHLVVSLNSVTSELKFYVNGALTKTWTSAGGIGPLTRVLKHGPKDDIEGALPFIIGAAASDADYIANNWDWLGNQLSYKGAIDELKLYNIALADGQVSKLYKDEKP